VALVNRRPGVRDRSDGLAELVITMRGVRGRAGNPGARLVEGLRARVVVKADGDPDAMATEIEDRVVGASVAPLFPGADQVGSRFGLADYYVVTLPTRRGSAASIGHDIAYELEKTPGVGRSFYEGVYRGFRVLGGAPGDNDAKAPADHDWSHQHVGLSATAARGGAGVVIGHPDTGWADHPELDRNRLDLTRQRNFVRVPETADARDPLTQAGNPGHGTSTGFGHDLGSNAERRRWRLPRGEPSPDTGRQLGGPVGGRYRR
jgi:hypothetical protein